MSVSFDELVNAYLELLPIQNNSIACHRALAKLELYQDLFPSDAQKHTIERLPMPLDSISSSGAYAQNGIKMKLNFNIIATSSSYCYTVTYTFDFHLKNWKWDNQERIQKDLVKLTLNEEREFLSSFSPMNHPALCVILNQDRDHFDQIFSFEDRAFKHVEVKEGKIFFTFIGGDDHFCYDPIKQHIFRLDKVFYEYDNLFSLILGQTNLLERIQNHPSIRLKNLFK